MPSFCAIAFEELYEKNAAPYWEYRKKKAEADRAKLRIELADLNENTAMAEFIAKQIGSELAQSDIEMRTVRAEFDAVDLSFSGLNGDATFDYQGVLIYKHVTADTDSIPWFFVEFSNQPIVKEASQVDVPWNVEGILQLS